MACGVGCNKKRNLLLNKIQNTNETATSKEVVFSGRWGKLAYFLILLVVACTPIINVAAIYMFYQAVYGGKPKKDDKKHKDINKT